MPKPFPGGSGSMQKYGDEEEPDTGRRKTKKLLKKMFRNKKFNRKFHEKMMQKKKEGMSEE